MGLFDWLKQKTKSVRENNILIDFSIKSDVKYDIEKQRRLLGNPLENILSVFCKHFNITYFSSKDKKKFVGFQITCWGVNFKPLCLKNITKEFKEFLKQVLDIVNKNLKKAKVEYKINCAGPLEGTYEDYANNLKLKED